MVFSFLDGENPPRNHMNDGGYNNPVHHPVIKSESSVIKAGVRPESRASEDYVSPPKYKSSLLNRYLNDSLRHVMVTNAAMMGKTRQRNHSGSFSSNEFEEELVSPSSSETEGNFVYRTGKSVLFVITLFKQNEGCSRGPSFHRCQDRIFIACASDLHMGPIILFETFHFVLY